MFSVFFLFAIIPSRFTVHFKPNEIVGKIKKKLKKMLNADFPSKRNKIKVDNFYSPARREKKEQFFKSKNLFIGTGVVKI